MARKKGWSGVKNNRAYEAKPYGEHARQQTLSAISLRPSGKLKVVECEKCGRPVRRSWRTEILWDHCFACRYLMMVYGPNIGVRWVGK